MFLSYKSLKLKLRMFLAGHIVAMVTYCTNKLTATFSAMAEYLSLAAIQSGYNDPSKSTSLKVLETVSSHVKLGDLLFKIL